MSEVKKFVLAVGNSRMVGRWDVVRGDDGLLASVTFRDGVEIEVLRTLSTMIPGRLSSPAEEHLADELRHTGIHPYCGFSVTIDPSTFLITIRQEWGRSQMMCWELSELAQRSVSKERRNVFDVGRKKALWRGYVKRRTPGLRRRGPRCVLGSLRSRTALIIEKCRSEL